MIKRLIIVGLVAALGAVFVPLLAGSAPTRRRDPNDTRGLLDVRRIRSVRPMRAVFRVDTFARWSAKQMRDRGYILIYLDTIPGPRFDYYVMARSTGSRMSATLYRDRRRKKDRRMGSVAVSRPSRRSVSVRFDLDRLRWPDTRDHYKWYVQTLFTSKRCRRVCFDRAPNRAPVIQYRPGASPTPTATPTTTPTATPSPTPTATPTPTPTAP